MKHSGGLGLTVISLVLVLLISTSLTLESTQEKLQEQSNPELPTLYKTLKISEDYFEAFYKYYLKLKTSLGLNTQKPAPPAHNPSKLLNKAPSTPLKAPEPPKPPVPHVTNFTEPSALFQVNTIFEGTWQLVSKQGGELFNGFTQSSGNSLLQFDYSNKPVTRIGTKYSENKYIDTKKAYLFANLTQSNFSRATSTFSLSINNTDKKGSLLDIPDYRFWSENHIMPEPDLSKSDLNMTMVFTDINTGKPFNINRTDADNVSITVEWTSNNVKLRIEYKNAKFESPYYLEFLWIFLMLVGAIICNMGSNRVFKKMDHFERSSQGPYSMVILSSIYFQYFGIYVLFTISGSQSFLFFAAGMLTTMFGALGAYKVAFLLFFERWANHPRMNQGGCCSPRGLFIWLTMVFFVGNYMVSIYAIRFLSYSYYLSVLSLFPLVNIFENICSTGGRKCFSK